MLHLRTRAHQSLDDFRKGKNFGSPVSRHMQDTSDEDDELAMLGGKSRLVKKEEPSSPPLLDRSPVTQNPVVPLPLSAGTNMDPNMLEYLSSFTNNHHTQPLSASSHGSFSDLDMAPDNMYGISNTSTYTPEQTYGMAQPQQMMQNHRHHQHQHQHQQNGNGNGMNGHHQSNGMSNGNGLPVSSFPQYFPVYDYNQSMGMDTSSSYVPMLDTNPRPGQRRSNSGSPDANTMHSTWQDFVALQMPN